MRIYTPTVVQGEWGWGAGWNPSPGYLYVAVFRNDLAFVESLSSSRQAEVYFMGGGVTSPKMVAILDFTKN